MSDAFEEGPDPEARARRVDRWCDFGALLLIALVGLLVWPTIAMVGYRFGVDEGYYVRHYVAPFSEQGFAAFPAMFRFYLSDEQNWIFPPPTRSGFIVLAGLWTRLFEVAPDAAYADYFRQFNVRPDPIRAYQIARSLSYLSLASHLALIAVQYLFARRHLGARCALAIAALTACSPVALGLSRRALTDPTICLTQVATMWLFLELVRNPTRLLPKVAFAASFTLALLVKEIGLLLVLPLAAFAAIERFHRRTHLPIGSTLAALALPPVLTVIGWIATAQDAEKVWRVVWIVIKSPASNTFAIEFGSGPWYRYLVDEVAVSPWPTLLGLAGIALALWRWREGAFDRVAVFFSVVYVLQLVALAPFTKNLRYAMPLEAPLRALAVFGLWTMLGGERKRVARLVVATVVAALFTLDWSTFHRMFVELQTYDPLTVRLLQMQHMLPMDLGR